MDKIFDTTKMIEEYDRTVRMSLSWIYPSELRELAVKTHEAHLELAKLASKTAKDLYAKSPMAAVSK